jgi:hypothetical protein
MKVKIYSVVKSTLNSIKYKFSFFLETERGDKTVLLTCHKNLQMFNKYEIGRYNNPCE